MLLVTITSPKPTAREFRLILDDHSTLGDLNEAALRRTLARAVGQAFVELSCVAEEEYLCDASTSDHA